MTQNHSTPFWESPSKGRKSSAKRKEKSTHNLSRKDTCQTGETTSTQTSWTGTTKTLSSPQVTTKFTNSPWTALTLRTQKFMYGPGSKGPKSMPLSAVLRILRQLSPMKMEVYKFTITKRKELCVWMSYTIQESLLLTGVKGLSWQDPKTAWSKWEMKELSSQLWNLRKFINRKFWE